MADRRPPHPSSARSATPRRVAIVGAGPGGLAAAMLLSHAGAQVTVYERAPQIGGRSATFTGQSAAGPFTFDTGPTFFLYPRVLADIMAACGRRLEEEVDLVRLDPQYDVVFEDGARIRATPDMTRMAAEVARLSPADAAALPRFMADNRAKLELFRPVLEMPFNSYLDLVSRPMLRALPRLRPWHTVDSDLGTYFKDERVRLAFSFQSKYLGMSPFRCPSLFTILSFMEYEHGVYHPIGGCGAVLKAMARVATDLGADIRVSTPVEQVLVEGGAARGIRTARGDEYYDAVVMNADFAHGMKNLVPNAARRRWTDRRIDAKKFSCSTFMLYLGLEGALDELAHHTIHLSTDYRRNISDIEAGLAPEAPSFYIQNACVTDPALAPPGHSALYVLVPVGNLSHGRVDWRAEAARYREHVLDLLEARGVPDIRRRIRYERMVTPIDWRDDLAVHEGATFNLAHSINQMLVWRPRNRFEDIARLYLVGGGTHPGSGLPVIFEGARISAKLLAEDLGLDVDWTTEMAAEPHLTQDTLEPAL